MIPSIYDVMVLCPDRNVPVKTTQPSMTPEQFASWRQSNSGGIAWWVNCTACARRHLVLTDDCFLQLGQSQP
jgi:hypothetical protein